MSPWLISEFATNGDLTLQHMLVSPGQALRAASQPPRERRESIAGVGILESKALMNLAAGYFKGGIRSEIPFWPCKSASRGRFHQAGLGFPMKKIRGTNIIINNNNNDNSNNYYY